MNYFLLTVNKSAHFISEEEADKIKKAEFGSAVVLKDGTWLKTSNIGEILPENKYYELHPEKRPVSTVEVFKVPKEEYVPLEKMAERHKGNYRALLTGLKKYLDEHPDSVKNNGPAFQLYKRKLERYKELFSSVI